MRGAVLSLCCVSIATIIACGGEADGGGRALRAVRDTVGDTIIVRTEAGSAWGVTRELVPVLSIGVLQGEDAYMFGDVRALAIAPDDRILVLDSQVPAVRVYAPDGTYLRDMGRAGEGPGEYEEPDGGLTYLPDGRVVVRDPGTGKIVVFSGEGEHLDDWRLPYGGTFSTSEGLYWDSAGHLLTPTITNLGAPVTDWERGFIRWGPDGSVIDTLAPPEWDFDTWVVSGEDENSSSSRRVPFGPDTEVRYSPLGYFVGGLSTDYRIDQFRPDGTVLRIERAPEPVRVNPDEAQILRRRIEESFRGRFQGWSWNGPDIPERKPPFSDLFVADDGRLWVVVATPSREIMSGAEAAEEERATGRIVNRYRAPVAFDVFEPTGVYLGRVDAPEGFSLSPRPVFRGETVWAVMRDELEVQRVTRLELAPVD